RDRNVTGVQTCALPISALVAVEVVAEAVGHRQGLLLGENGRAGVALLVGVVPVLVVARQVQLQLARLELGLLQAVDVRVRQGAEVQKALPDAGPQAVDVPRNQFHLFSSPVSWCFYQYNKEEGRSQGGSALLPAGPTFSGAPPPCPGVLFSREKSTQKRA